jgi:hypothetical protein
MILPDPQPQPVNISSSSSSSDSSSEDTLSDSSHDTISTLIRKGPKLQPKTKTLVKEFGSDGNSLLDHLTSHTSGDAFTSSNFNAPKSLENVFHASPIHFVEPEQENLQNTLTNNEPKQEIPTQTTLPNQETLVNVSETPRESKC